MDSLKALLWIMLFFSIIRYGVGYDYYSYLNNILYEQEDFVYARLEPLSYFLVYVAKLTASPELYFAIYSILTIYPVYYVCKKWSVNPTYSLCVYLLFPSFYISSLDIIRNALAFSIVFLAMYFLYIKKIKVFLFCIFIATMSHSSAPIALILLAVNFLPKSKYFYMLIIVVSILLGETINKLSFISSFPVFNSYVEYAKEVGSMKYLMVIFAILNYITWDKVKKNEQGAYLLKIMSIGLSFFFLFMIDDTLSFRLSNYFLFSMIPLIPLQLQALKMSYIKAKNISISFFITIIIFQNYLVINDHLKTNERMSNYPYQTIFYKVDYINTRY